MNKKKQCADKKICIKFAFAILLIAYAAQAVPPFPTEFYGTVEVNGADAPAGTEIVARIGSEQKGSIIVSDGIYGGPKAGDSKLIVNEGNGTIVFFVKLPGRDYIQAEQNATYDSKIHELNITAGYSVTNAVSSIITTANGSAALDARNASVMIDIRTAEDRTFAVDVSEFSSNVFSDITGRSFAKGVSIDASAAIEYAIIKIFYSDSEISGMDESSLKIYYYNQSWQETSSAVNSAENYVSANVTHFSMYALFGSAAPAAEAAATAAGGAGGAATLPKINATCAENWSCSQWTPCDGVQSRVCIDINACGTIANKPLEERVCEMPETANITRANVTETNITAPPGITGMAAAAPNYTAAAVIIIAAIITFAAWKLRKRKEEVRKKKTSFSGKSLSIKIIMMLLLFSYIGYASQFPTANYSGFVEPVQKYRDYTAQNGMKVSVAGIKNYMPYEVETIVKIPVDSKSFFFNVSIQPNMTWEYARIGSIIVVPGSAAVIDDNATSYYPTGEELVIVMAQSAAGKLYIYTPYGMPVLVITNTNVNWRYDNDIIRIESAGDSINKTIIFWPRIPDETTFFFDAVRAENLASGLPKLNSHLEKLGTAFASANKTRNELKANISSLSSEIETMRREKLSLESRGTALKEDVESAENAITSSVIISPSHVVIGIIAALILIALLADAVFFRKGGEDE